MKWITLLLLTLLIYGCGGMNGGNGDAPVDSDFRTGTGSLNIFFERGLPPNEIFADSTTTFVVAVENQGAYNVDRGYFSLSVDKSVINLLDGGDEIFSLEGKNAMNPRGDSDIITIDAEILPLPAQSQRRDAQLIATICYPYESIQQEVVCVDNDPFNQRSIDDKLCTVDDVSFSPGGSPVNVELGEVTFVGLNNDDTLLEPRFTFHIRIQGNGKVFLPGSERAFCNSQAVNEESIHKVTFNATLSDDLMQCPKEVLLRDGVGRVNCIGDAVDIRQGAFETSVTTHIGFGYADSISKRVEVIR